MKPVTLKVGGSHEIIWEILLFHGASNMCTIHIYFPNPSGQIVHNCHAWSMRFLYVILAHMVVGITLHKI